MPSYPIPLPLFPIKFEVELEVRTTAKPWGYLTFPK